MFTAALLVACLTTQVESAEIDLKTEVPRLVRQLDAADEDARVAAEKQLVKLGIDVLSHLPRVDANTSAEVSQRLNRVRFALERIAANATADASRLTLKGTYGFSDLLVEIEKQTGNRIVDFRDRFGESQNDVQLDLDIDDKPFWEAFDSILDQAGLTVYTFVGQTRTLGVVARGNEGDRLNAGSYAGPFRIAATYLEAKRNLRNVDDQSLWIRLELLWEPRTVPILVRHAYGDLEIVGDDGNPIAAASVQGALELPVQSTVAGIEDLEMPFELPGRDVKKIAQLSGRFTAMIPGREETFEFDELENARNEVLQRGGLTVTLDRVRKNGILYEFRIRLRFQDADDSLQSHLDWASNNEVYLVAPDGTRIDNPNFEKYLEREDEVGYAYLFPTEGDLTGHRLVYKSPAAIINLPIDYELTDIPLP